MEYIDAKVAEDKDKKSAKRDAGAAALAQSLAGGDVVMAPGQRKEVTTKKAKQFTFSGGGEKVDMSHVRRS